MAPALAVGMRNGDDVIIRFSHLSSLYQSRRLGANVVVEGGETGETGTVFFNESLGWLKSDEQRGDGWNEGELLSRATVMSKAIFPSSPGKNWGPEK